jgi:integrase/recombinase XerD
MSTQLALKRPPLRDTLPTGLAVDDIRGFERSLLARGLRPDTIERAIRTASRFLYWCGDQDPASLDTVEAFLADAGRSIRRITLANYHKDLGMFFRWAESKGLVASNPVAQIPKPQPSLYERERDTRSLPYTDAEFQRLLDACPPFWQGWLGLRDRALMWLLWETPLRASEIVALVETDIDWAGSEVRVRDGKGGVRYEAIISVNCADALDDYRRRRLPQQGVAAFFLDRHGLPLSRHGLYLMVRRTGKRAGITKPVFPHMFRHNFRARVRAKGGDDARVSPLMGHSGIVVTQSYARDVARRDAKAWWREQIAG